MVEVGEALLDSMLSFGSTFERNTFNFNLVRPTFNVFSVY